MPEAAPGHAVCVERLAPLPPWYGVLEFHIDADRVGQPAGEELHLLRRREGPRMRHASLKGLLEVLNGAAEWKASELGEVVRAHCRPKALLAEGLEADPPHLANVALQHVVPVLRDPSHVEGGEPHPVRVTGALRAEEVVAAIEPAERIFLAVERREGELVESWDADAIAVVVL